MAQTVIFDCFYRIKSTLMLGGCKAVISTVLGPTKFFTEELLVITTGWLGSKWRLALYLYIIYLNSIHSVMEIVVVKF